MLDRLTNKVKTIKQLMSMDGRTVLLTGATGGLGQYMAETVAELGGDLILVDRPGSNYIKLLDNLNKYTSVVKCFDCDLENKNERKQLIEKIKQQELTVNVLINNGAFVGEEDLQGWTVPFEEQSVDTWRRALEVNLTAVFDLSKGLASKLRQDGNGSIVNIASIYGISAPDYSLYEGTSMGNPAGYSASKGGLIQLTRWLSTTVAPDIRVNSISPGGIWRKQPEKFVKRYERRTPLARMATEEDFKGVIAYLISDMSAYVTGQNIVVDGGWSV
jgi:NAD(P)-dependent dehydrogenase (short-subunit alcohol dehydrogenase family)